MSVLYVAGHGNHEIGSEQQQEPKVKIPEGLTVSFYADDDHALRQLIGYRIAELGGMEALLRNTYPEKEEIYNYEINELKLAEYLNYRTTASAEFHNIVQYVGYGPVTSPILLCTTPEDENCNAGTHNCDGLLGSAGPIAQFGVTDLRLIICRTPTIDHRALTTGVLKTTETLPGEEVVEDQLSIGVGTEIGGEDGFAGKVVTSGLAGPYVKKQQAKQERWLEWISEDPENAVAEFEKLRKANPEEQGFMLENVYLREALYTYYGKKFIEEHGPFAFYRYVESLPPDMKAEYLASGSKVTPTLDASTSVVAWFNMFDQSEDERVDLWRQLGDVARRTILETELRGLPNEVAARFQKVRVWHEQVKDTLGDLTGTGGFQVKKIQTIDFSISDSDDDF